jgi:hypothetical protein
MGSCFICGPILYAFYIAKVSILWENIPKMVWFLIISLHLACFFNIFYIRTDMSKENGGIDRPFRNVYTSMSGNLLVSRPI